MRTPVPPGHAPDIPRREPRCANRTFPSAGRRPPSKCIPQSPTTRKCIRRVPFSGGGLDVDPSPGALKCLPFLKDPVFGGSSQKTIASHP